MRGFRTRGRRPRTCEWEVTSSRSCTGAEAFDDRTRGILALTHGPGNRPREEGDVWALKTGTPWPRGFDDFPDGLAQAAEQRSAHETFDALCKKAEPESAHSTQDSKGDTSCQPACPVGGRQCGVPFEDGSASASGALHHDASRRKIRAVGVRAWYLRPPQRGTRGAQGGIVPWQLP
jgi:hypothetical protein